MNPLLSEKIERVFADRAVSKRHALQAGFEAMPRFVTEFLLARAREKTGTIDIAKTRTQVRKFSVDADRRSEFISRLMREGQARLIALLEVEPKPERNEHIARIAQLDGQELRITDELLAQYPELLYGGLWGSAALSYDTSMPRPRILVEAFEPFQATAVDVEEFRQAEHGLAP